MQRWWRTDSHTGHNLLRSISCRHTVRLCLQRAAEEEVLPGTKHQPLARRTRWLHKHGGHRHHQWRKCSPQALPRPDRSDGLALAATSSICPLLHHRLRLSITVLLRERHSRQPRQQGVPEPQQQLPPWQWTLAESAANLHTTNQRLRPNSDTPLFHLALAGGLQRDKPFGVELENVEIVQQISTEKKAEEGDTDSPCNHPA
mmetsp:Transcript_1419/g.2546  ORF Transcript_1419/g.2546 Transcript_1419/m.2546 type:complete len:202 (+) Transcript_1419:1038-1643(+)